jgi:alanyl-tRNA synthetase
MEAMARELVHARVAAWREEAEDVGTRRAVLRVLDDDEALAASEAAHAAVADGGIVAGLVLQDGPKCQVFLAASGDVDVDCGSLLKGALTGLGGRGGGQPEFARGGCPDADARAVLEALRAALRSEAGD